MPISMTSVEFTVGPKATVEEIIAEYARRLADAPEELLDELRDRLITAKVRSRCLSKPIGLTELNEFVEALNVKLTAIDINNTFTEIGKHKQVTARTIKIETEKVD